MRLQACLLGCLAVTSYFTPLAAIAQDVVEASNDANTSADVLGRLEQRLNDLEANNQALHQDNTRLLDQLIAEQREA